MLLPSPIYAHNQPATPYFSTMISFFKYQGTGNDFVLIDNRKTSLLTRKDTEKIQRMCDRRFGIGADGLILLQNTPGHDFEMVYFNADGRESSMCGNGGRCVSAFAKMLGIIQSKCNFLAIDGEHEAIVSETGWVELKMGNVNQIETGDDCFVLNTGSPHYVVFVEDISNLNVAESGRVIRYSDRFRKEGINVNFVEKKPDGIIVATYERGVEDETLSCGTGVTAAAISFFLKSGLTQKAVIAVETKGGNLKVRLEKTANGFENIWLCGPTAKTFAGGYFEEE